jgi:very-short-patch-repair endonuclease
MWHHKKASIYQMRMKGRPTRSERRFDDILDKALEGFKFPSYKPTQVNRRGPKRKFKKQRIFEDQRNCKAYIVDFYIPDIKLVIEVDGPSHDKQKEYDEIRTRFLASKGIKVIRIKNEETLDADSLINKIRGIILGIVREVEVKKKLERNPEYYKYLYGYVPKWAQEKISHSYA